LIAAASLDDTAEIEAARGEKVAQTEKVRQHGRIAIAVCGGGRAFASVLAGEVLRFQCLHQGEEGGEVELHARESDEAGIVGTSEGLAMEQLGVLVRRRAGAHEH
jgi:hypothetical protein